MRKYFLVMVATAIITGGCSSTFLISKDGKGYFLGSNSSSIFKMLCDSGDLTKVLSDTKLPPKMKDDLYRYNCSSERSGDKVKEIYASMTHDQRKDLRSAFKNNGYDVNYLPC